MFEIEYYDTTAHIFPQTPGILVAKKRLFSMDRPPSGAGGGTVLFVDREQHMYLQGLNSIGYFLSIRMKFVAPKFVYILFNH